MNELNEKNEHDKKFIKLLGMKAKDTYERYKTPFFSIKMHKYALFAFWYNNNGWWWETWLEHFLKTDLAGQKVLLEQLIHKNLRLPEKYLPEAFLNLKWAFQQRLEWINDSIILLTYDTNNTKFDNLPIEEYDNTAIFEQFNEIITKGKYKEPKAFLSLKGHLKGGSKKKK